MLPLLLALAPMQDPVPADASARLDRDALTGELVELMRAGIDVREPYRGWPSWTDQETHFDGSYDWHSCVIAHWALLVAARTRGDAELLDDVVARLDPGVLRHEHAIATARPTERVFLYPYDEAWFLLLLSELARHGARVDVDAPLVAELRESLEERLLAHLASAPFPELAAATRDEATSPYAGSYRSWIWGALALLWSDPVTEGANARLDELLARRLEGAREEILAHPAPRRDDFLWVPALLALVDLTRPEGTGSDVEPPPFDEWPDSVSLADVHRLGMELSRVWPDAVRAHAGDRAARDRFERRVASLVARRDLWAEDFEVVSHWMPQYLFIGLWLENGRP